MRVTSKGQVTIPAHIRERLGFHPETEVEFIIEGNTLRVVRAEPSRQSRGDRIVRRLRGTATVRMTTDEILALTREP